VRDIRAGSVLWRLAADGGSSAGLMRLDRAPGTTSPGLLREKVTQPVTIGPVHDAVRQTAPRLPSSPPQSAGAASAMPSPLAHRHR